MQTKTYFASSVPAALEVARRELGEEAMLVTSKPAAAAARPFGRLEVTFAFDPKPAMARQEMRIPAQSRAASSRESLPMMGAAPGGSRVSELDEIRQQISALKQAVGRPAVRISEGRSGLAEELVANGLSSDVAGEVAAAVRASAAPDALSQELAARLTVTPFAELKSGESRTMALVGPPGRGKTTTLVKVAVRYGLASRIPVKIYLAGSHGIGGEDQMARYAAILGVPFQACESLESLSMALNGDQWKGLALIDTPGISPADSGEIGDFARFFKRRPEIEKHLVLRADARSADLSHVIARFGAMEVSRLLFTGLDETVSLGSMADAMMRTRIPAALAGTGQRIPEDLETVNAAQLARALQGEDASAALAA
jgi:flagellar biosynthesis protein FlhF